MIRARGDSTDSRQGRMTEGSNAAGKLFGVATRWTTYARLFHLLLSFPISLAGWIALVVLLSVGGGLAITVVGIPLLAVTMFAWCFYADLERLFTNTLLGTTIRPLPFGRERGLKWPWERLKARLSNAYTWRSLAFLLLVRFPMGVAGFVWATVIIGTVFQLLFAPFDVMFSIETEVFGWYVDKPWEAAVCVVAGVALIIPALHLLSFGGWLCGRITTWCLQSPETDVPQPWGEALDRAATSAVTWPGVVGRKFGEKARRERSLQMKVWLAHAGLYAAVMLVLFVIDALTAPGTWWVLWPIWGWGIALALHTGYLLGGLLGGHALAFAVTNLGLAVIDLELVTDSTWFFWPLVSWAIALAAHAFVYFGFAPVRGVVIDD